MNTIQVISIFVCGFAFGLILFILLEKIFVPEVDYLEDDIYRDIENNKKSKKPYSSHLKISPKQKFIGDTLGLNYPNHYNKEESSLDNLKTKIFELKNRNKVAL
tara:strand:+ start:346 stop:657 length:312 start_codon:yes stop_codon:yes gene_type:complete